MACTTVSLLRKRTATSIIWRPSDGISKWMKMNHQPIILFQGTDRPSNKNTNLKSQTRTRNSKPKWYNKGDSWYSSTSKRRIYYQTSNNTPPFCCQCNSVKDEKCSTEESPIQSIQNNMKAHQLNLLLQSSEQERKEKRFKSIYVEYSSGWTYLTFFPQSAWAS